MLVCVFHEPLFSWLSCALFILSRIFFRGKKSPQSEMECGFVYILRGTFYFCLCFLFPCFLFCLLLFTYYDALLYICFGFYFPYVVSVFYFVCLHIAMHFYFCWYIIRDHFFSLVFLQRLFVFILLVVNEACVQDRRVMPQNMRHVKFHCICYIIYWSVV